MSENVASCGFFAYHADAETERSTVSLNFNAIRHIKEKRAKMRGVDLMIALSDHWRCVSIPRCARASSNKISMLKRITNASIINSGVWRGLDETKGTVCILPSGSLTSTHRTFATV